MFPATATKVDSQTGGVIAAPEHHFLPPQFISSKSSHLEIPAHDNSYLVSTPLISITIAFPSESVTGGRKLFQSSNFTLTYHVGKGRFLSLSIDGHCS